MSTISNQIIIDSEFRDLIPPLTVDERKGLEADILAEGCLDSLKVWETELGNILIDGHNRKSICDAHGFPYEAESIPGLESREDVKRWIIQHQRHRRNLNEAQRAMLAEILATMDKGNPHRGQDKLNAQNCAFNSQSEVAEQFNVSRRSVQYARKVRELGIPALAQMVTAGQVSVSAAAEVAKLPEDQQREIVAGGVEAIQEASRQMHRKQDTENYPEENSVSIEQVESEPAPIPQMPEEDILFCAHCGNPAKAVKDFDIFQGVRYYVICQNEDCSMQTPLRKKREEVIEIWNRRQ
ncbi:MAG: hypothetical protein JXR78_06950 [Victivallales bacterium]|nr:hypothetical protein [Victivallales bacterium]